MHDVVTGYFLPNELDKAAGIMGGFGTTINIINGNVECGGENKESEKRARYYRRFLEHFKLPSEDDDKLLCKNQSDFPAGGTGDVAAYFT